MKSIHLLALSQMMGRKDTLDILFVKMIANFQLRLVTVILTR